MNQSKYLLLDKIEISQNHPKTLRKLQGCETVVGKQRNCGRKR